MIPFPATSLLSTGAVPFLMGDDIGTDQVNGCQGYTLGMPRGTLSVVAAADERMGAARYAAGGILRLYDATSALPAGAVSVGGLAMSSTGQLCITTDAVSGATFIGGMAVRSDGAVFASDMSPAAWFRFNAGITEAGAGVSAWADASGNSRNLLQGTDGNRPTKQADGSILFNGTDEFMSTAGFTSEQPLTDAYLLKQVTWTAGDYISDGATVDKKTLYQNTTTPNLRGYSGSFGTPVAGPAIGVYGVVIDVRNGASSGLATNTGAMTLEDFGANDPNGLVLGASGGGALFSNIEVREVIRFHKALSEAERWFIVHRLAEVGGVTL